MLNGSIVTISNQSLITEFTDIKSVVHKVKHSLIPTSDIKEHQDKISDDLYRVFTRSCKGGKDNGNSILCEKVNRTRK